MPATSRLVIMALRFEAGTAKAKRDWGILPIRVIVSVRAGFEGEDSIPRLEARALSVSPMERMLAMPRGKTRVMERRICQEGRRGWKR